MEELTFKDCEFDYDSKWLGTKEVKVGYVYILKDGRIAMYLGKTEQDMYCFYVFCKMQFKNLPDRVLSFANYEVQVAGIVNMCKESMNYPAYRESVLELKNLPKIYCEFPFAEFTESYESWYKNSFDTHKDLPSLCVISNVKPDGGYVSAKDLIPGHLYCAGEYRRDVYVYLGRKSIKEFLWYFVRSVDTLLSSTAYRLIRESDSTKSNKKVKPLNNALTDPNVKLWDEDKELVDMNYCVDMSGVTQEMLDCGGFGKSTFF